MQCFLGDDREAGAFAQRLDEVWQVPGDPREDSRLAQNRRGDSRIATERGEKDRRFRRSFIVGQAQEASVSRSLLSPPAKVGTPRSTPWNSTSG